MKPEASIHHGSFFTAEQWSGELAEYIAKLRTLPGGVLLIAVQIDATSRNYPEIGFGVFSKEERETFKRSLMTARKKREAKTT